MSEIIGSYGSGAETGAGTRARVHIETFGCTANAGDTQKLRAILKRSGYQLVTDYKKADCVIVNTCTVTKRTELNVVKRLEELKKQGKHVIVAGCMAAAQPELVKSVLGKDTIMITPEELYPVMDFDFDNNSSVVGIIPISMGCLGECTYCIVKRARGRLKSLSPDRICSALRSAVAAGVKEIRITAQDCAAYGFDRTDMGMDMAVKLPELLRMLTEVEGDFRIRIGMMNPFTLLCIIDELLEAFESDKVFKFFHIPVQSGSDKVLSDMRRNYKVADFVEIVRRIRRRFHYCTICTDFIVGFPTEDEDDFRASLQLLEEVKPEKVNITRFSPRPGTEASKLKDMLARDKKMRSRTMSAIYHRMALEANNQLIGAELPVLVTERGDKGGVIARDPSYKTIILEEDLPPGSFHKVRVKDARSTYLVASVIS
ncbi:MAG: hypothetical protein C4B56_05415 [Candidatus Methanophagaceae archaeon]|nr:MAG: hypothetical protein C4B56_05415 [Methanophagales archaeon]